MNGAVKQLKCEPLFKRRTHGRVWELDFLRGLAVLLMLWDHLMFDFYLLDVWFPNFYAVGNQWLFDMNSFATNYLNSGLRFYGHYFFSGLFLFLTGVSNTFSRNNTTRALKLGAVAIGFTVASIIINQVMSFDTIVMGILQTIFVGIVLYAAIESFTSNKYAHFGVAVVIIAIGCTFPFWSDSLWVNKLTVDNFVQVIIGSKHYGADCFGIAPFVGFALLGAYWGKAMYSERKTLFPQFAGKWSRPFEFVGRHALIVYIVHQVVLAVLVAVIAMALGCRF